MIDTEPFYGWLHWYDPEKDELSPFYGVEHNLFQFDRKIYNLPTHPLWEDIDSDSLLVKILFADYTQGFAILELIGEWNDLHFNDFRLLREHCLDLLGAEGISRFILVCENVFNVYVSSDDYYADFHETWEEGWIFLLRARPMVLQEFIQYGISAWLGWSAEIDELNWRKYSPEQLYELIQKIMQKYYLG